MTEDLYCCTGKNATLFIKDPLHAKQKLFRPRISAFYRNMEIWKLMETNKVNIDAKLYRQKIGLHCSIAPLCMEIGQPVALIQPKVNISEVMPC